MHSAYYRRLSTRAMSDSDACHRREESGRSICLRQFLRPRICCGKLGFDKTLFTKSQPRTGTIPICDAFKSCDTCIPF